MDPSAPPNGWLFWPDANGSSTHEVTLHVNLNRKDILYESVCGTDEVDCLGVEVQKAEETTEETSFVTTSRCSRFIS